MRRFTIIGALILLIFPFSISQSTTEFGGTKLTVRGYYGLIYNSYSDDTSTALENSEFFMLTWLTDDSDKDVYEGYFAKDGEDELWKIGILLLLLVLSIPVIATLKPNHISSTLILLICGLSIFFLRLRTLLANDYSLFQQEESFGVKTTYIEIPIGLLFAIIFCTLGHLKDTVKN